MGKNECIAAMDFMKDWKTWRESLHDAIAEGRKYGMSDEEIKELAVTVGDFLAKNVCPGTNEEALLKEMWDISTPQERKILASLIFRMVE